MQEGSSPPVTVLLQEWRRGDRDALGQVAEIVDRELRRLASGYLRRESSGHTLQPTALVNEAYLRLMGQAERIDWESRTHFIGIAARHMRQILVDHARRNSAGKRGGGVTVIPLDDAPAAAPGHSTDLLALHEALEKLAAVDARKAQVMELKYFGGLEMAEIALLLNLSIKTIEKDARLAGVWLRAALEAPPPRD